jgi:tRNA (cmo5U34)-methyltransferase
MTTACRARSDGVDCARPGNGQRGPCGYGASMKDPVDTNAAIWKSDAVVSEWTSTAADRERARGSHWRQLARLLPFDEADEFTFLDLGAGTGSASGVILDCYPGSTAILTDYSSQMIDQGERDLARFAGRFRYLEFDMVSGEWPVAIPSAVDAVVTSLCVHHLPDDRKRGLFAEIYDRLAPGGWYFNYDPVTSADPVVETTWQRVTDRGNPGAAAGRAHRSPAERARHENHVRYMIPLDPQLEFLRNAGFEGIDVYWKYLENVIYGGRRPR